MTATTAIIILGGILLLLAGYARDFNDDSLRKYAPKKKRNGRTYKR